MCSFLNNLFTAAGNTCNNTVYSKNRIGKRNVHSKLPIIVFQINSISLTDSGEFRETSINPFIGVKNVAESTGWLRNCNFHNLHCLFVYQVGFVVFLILFVTLYWRFNHFCSVKRIQFLFRIRMLHSCTFLCYFDPVSLHISLQPKTDNNEG